jgi:RNA polymerase sigma-70 factor (family 1)
MRYDEKRLLSELVSGDERAFTTLYDLYWEPIYKLVLKYLKSSELARDVSQEIMMQIWEGRGKLAHVRNLQSYLYNVARNNAVNVLRAAGRSDIVMGEIARNFNRDAVCYPDDTLQKDYQAFIKRILDTLPPRSKEVFLLCREEGRTYEEVAAALGISKNAIRNYMVVALDKLREAAKDEFGVSFTLLLPLLVWFASAKK